MITKELCFEKDIDEIDTYIIKSSSSRGHIYFIWDGDIKINIDFNQIYKSNISGSPCTDELIKFDLIVEKDIYSKIRFNNETIKRLENLKDNAKKDSLTVLKLDRDDMISNGPKRLRDFTRQYLKDNPASFVALYKMQINRVIISESDMDVLRKMPKALKEHHRFELLYSQ